MISFDISNHASFTKVFSCKTGQVWQKPFMAEDELKRFSEEAATVLSQYSEGGHRLGGALYMRITHDSNRDYETYLETRHNPAYKLEPCERIVRKIESTLTEFLGTKVRHSDALGPVGLLILNDSLPYLRPHFDFQFRYLPKEIKENYQLEKCFTFTLPLILPPSVNGLNLWSMTVKELAECAHDKDIRVAAEDLAEMAKFGFTDQLEHDTAMYARLKKCDFKFVKYEPGVLNLMIGNVLHQAIAITGPEMNPRSRVVMVGHGLMNKNGEWEIYW